MANARDVRDRQAEQESNGARVPGDEKAAPEKPTDLRRRSWPSVLRRTVAEFRRDNLTDWAAVLTYYGILAIFPALLVLVSILGLIGESATQPLIENLGSVAPGPAQEILTSALTNLQDSQGAAGVLLVVGLAIALWSASGYVAAFMRASNSIYDVEEGRPFWKTTPVRVLTTLVLLVFLGLVAIGVTLTGGLAKEAGKVVGVGDTAVEVWDIAKWPVLLAAVITMFAILYWAAPNVKHPRFRWLTPGSVLGVLIWLAASAGFALYVANFSSYNETYGALGGVIVFLIWLWISNAAILIGAEFNAELVRERQIEGGLRPRDREPFLEPRDTRKIEDEKA
jgi:membrane protein